LANAALCWGATPLPVEIEVESWNLRQSLSRDAIAQHRPQAVIAVNTFGVPAEFDEILATGVPVIEDCAHAFGISAAGKPLGSRAHAGVLSFYATKLLGGGEGGAVLTNDAGIAAYVRSARDYTDQPPSPHRMNDKMNDLEASLVLSQLERLPELIAAREKIARRYLSMLSDSVLAGRLFSLPPGATPRVWYRFVVQMLTVPAETIVQALLPFGVHAAIPILDWRPSGSLESPAASQAYRHLVSLPLYPSLTANQQECVVKAFLQVCEDLTRG
jgi:dTDP-4-amino-4,6-dideoxygalactose transaminase